mmetsp:Transcript_20960/g.65836  ORF Transcript_20960/g.65836 Transcript_20960/m.65836 type:complete len:307 (+) Transcript_20960:259-1179(+)
MSQLMAAATSPFAAMRARSLAARSRKPISTSCWCWLSLLGGGSRLSGGELSGSREAVSEVCEAMWAQGLGGMTGCVGGRGAGAGERSWARRAGSGEARGEAKGGAAGRGAGRAQGLGRAPEGALPGSWWCWGRFAAGAAAMSSMPSRRGDWTSSYILRSALKPSGWFSSWERARSWWRIASRRRAGERATSKASRRRLGSLRAWRSWGLASRTPRSRGFDSITDRTASGLLRSDWVIGELSKDIIASGSASSRRCISAIASPPGAPLGGATPYAAAPGSARRAACAGTCAGRTARTRWTVPCASTS